METARKGTAPAAPRPDADDSVFIEDFERPFAKSQLPKKFTSAEIEFYNASS